MQCCYNKLVDSSTTQIKFNVNLSTIPEDVELRKLIKIISINN